MPETDDAHGIEKILDLKKMPVILTIVFAIITLGIYCPIWFLRRRDSINALKSEENLGTAVFGFVIVMIFFSMFLMYLSGFIEGLAEEELLRSNFMDYTKAIDSTGKIINIVVGFILLFQCFKVRRIFNSHFNAYFNIDIRFSGVAIVFFTIFYLQYKINRFPGKF